ncbi:hypothetical protein F5883DRAFT_711172 [Diaporthe sp. PMI_573]|nr:hypothetical protein F5883DRAFT_711172 [Diaporthaceae sp. PMI_573]
MKPLAGSKRKTGTPVASPTKAAASTKRSRTQYDYCDEEDSESSPEYQWSADDSDSGSEMSVDGDEDQIHQPDSPSDKYASGPRGPRPLQDSRDTEEPVRLPHTASLPYGRGLTNTKTEGCAGCACSRFGKQCNPSTCSCQGGAVCRNPLKKLDLGAIFGQDVVVLHPCFMTWLAKQPKAKLERTSTQSLFEVVLEAIVMLDEYHHNMTEPYLEWRTKWDGLTALERDDGAGHILKQELLRWGLTSRDCQSVYYSFCRKTGDGSEDFESNGLSDCDPNYW